MTDLRVTHNRIKHLKEFLTKACIVYRGSVTKSLKREAGFSSKYLKKLLDGSVFLTANMRPSLQGLQRFRIKSTMLISGDPDIASTGASGGKICFNFSSI